MQWSTVHGHIVILLRLLTFFWNQRQFLDPALARDRVCHCRCFPLLVGTPGFLTQGKAGNQLGALRFSRGHFLQMMDAACRNIMKYHEMSASKTMTVSGRLIESCPLHSGSILIMSSVWYSKSEANMGAFLGEACKVPFILRRFQPHWSDRCQSAQ